MVPQYEADLEQVVVRGLVIPADWDNNGRVLAVFIATADEDQYFVQENEIVKQLLRLLRQEVVISGIMREVDGRKFLIHCNLSTLAT